MRLLLVGFVTLCTVNGLAQKDPSRPEPVGTITGHVICADTQRPARLAQVRLVAVPAAGLTDRAADAVYHEGKTTQTSLDGSFALRNVSPGEYFLTVDKDGYLSPLSEFTSKDLASQNPAMRVRVSRELRPVSVRGDQTVVQDIRLERGASVAGTILFDDGTPASGLQVQVLQKKADGSWQERQTNGLHYRGELRTDDFGRYRLSGLPAGDYATEVDLILTERVTSFGPMPGYPDRVMTLNLDKTRYSLGLYSGDKLRKTQAEAYTLGNAQDRTGADLTFPLSKLHEVSGQLVSKAGHPINGGKVALVYADDQSPLTDTEVNYEEALFRLDFVPEGEFELKVSGAKDLARTMVENAKGFTPRFREETKTVKEYGDTKKALTVKGDTSDVVAMVPDAKDDTGK